MSGALLLSHCMQNFMSFLKPTFTMHYAYVVVAATTVVAVLNVFKTRILDALKQ